MVTHTVTEEDGPGPQESFPVVTCTVREGTAQVVCNSDSTGERLGSWP